MKKVLKNRIIALYRQGLNYDQIASKLRCAKSTISYHCSDIRQKEDKFSPERIIIYQQYYDEGNSLKKTASRFSVSSTSLSKRLKIRRLTKFQREQRAKSRMQSYRVGVKQKCIEYKGGKCHICGYDKCKAALSFHHLDSSQKDYTISGGTKSFENLKSELDKCILVCSNCHQEIHSGLHTLDGLVWSMVDGYPDKIEAMGSSPVKTTFYLVM